MKLLNDVCFKGVSKKNIFSNEYMTDGLNITYVTQPMLQNPHLKKH